MIACATNIGNKSELVNTDSCEFPHSTLSSCESRQLVALGFANAEPGTIPGFYLWQYTCACQRNPVQNESNLAFLPLSVGLFHQRSPELAGSSLFWLNTKKSNGHAGQAGPHQAQGAGGSQRQALFLEAKIVLNPPTHEKHPHNPEGVVFAFHRSIGQQHHGVEERPYTNTSFRHL